MSDQFDDTAEDPFNLNFRFFEYLKLAQVDPAAMAPGQYQEMKRTYYGAMGQMLALFMVDVPNMPEKESTPKIMWMQDQIMKFWQGEVEKSQAMQN